MPGGEFPVGVAPREAAFAVRTAESPFSTMRIGSRSAGSATMAVRGVEMLAAPSAETDTRPGGLEVAVPAAVGVPGGVPVTVGG